MASSAQAVDGVGLLEFFPALEWILWLAEVSLALVLLKIGFFPADNAPTRSRRVLVGVLAVLVASPFLVAQLTPPSVRGLCSIGASLKSNSQPDGWTPPSPGTRAKFKSTTSNHGELETNTVPGLLEYYIREGSILGIWKDTHRLVDERTSETLLSATYYGSRRTGPMVCDAAVSYWALREAFAKKAFAAAR